MRRMLLFGFIGGFIFSALARNVLTPLGTGGITDFLGFSILFAVVGSTLLVLRQKEWAAFSFGLLVGWIGGAFILWLIGMAIGVPLSLAN